LFGLTYDIWREIVADVAIAHEPLFTAMHQTAEDLILTSELIEELKQKKEIAVYAGEGEFKLLIDFVEDRIGGFVIVLSATEQLQILEQVKSDVASDRGFSSEEIRDFELEHGLDLQEEILEEIEEIYDVKAELGEDALVYELVVFDSQDIDDSQSSELVWQEDIEN
jgi:hypothetical protein